MKWTLLSTVAFFSTVASACPVGHVGWSKAEIAKYKKLSAKSHQPRRISNVAQTLQLLPTAGSQEPWGGSAPSKWRPEAILANAASLWLNTGWNTHDVEEVLVSVPVKMIFTSERVYGDGQTNASLNFGPGWKSSEPQLIATLIRLKNHSRRVVFSFSRQLNLTVMKFKVTSFVTDNSGKAIRSDETLDIKRQGDLLLAGWTVPPAVQFGDLETNRVVWVRPEGLDSSFPIDFKMTVTTADDLVNAAKGSKTANVDPLDPLNIRKKSLQKSTSVQQELLSTSFGAQWVKNDQGRHELRNESIHGEIHLNGAEIKTAVGGGLTWLVERGANSTFKNLYTCFDARNFQAESQQGVPSGGGWHEIGDAAETIINDLESAPVPVGFATGLPSPTPPDQTKFAWGLSDVATIRMLKPGDAVVTAAGDQTWKEDEAFRKSGDGSARGKEPTGAGRNYHWFFFANSQPTCTQEWVHNCRPNLRNHLGLSCP